MWIGELPVNSYWASNFNKICVNSQHDIESFHRFFYWNFFVSTFFNIHKSIHSSSFIWMKYIWSVKREEKCVKNFIWKLFSADLSRYKRMWANCNRKRKGQMLSVKKCSPWHIEKGNGTNKILVCMQKDKGMFKEKHKSKYILCLSGWRTFSIVSFCLFPIFDFLATISHSIDFQKFYFFFVEWLRGGRKDRNIKLLSNRSFFSMKIKTKVKVMRRIN